MPCAQPSGWPPITTSPRPTTRSQPRQRRKPFQRSIADILAEPSAGKPLCRIQEDSACRVTAFSDSWPQRPLLLAARGFAQLDGSYMLPLDDPAIHYGDPLLSDPVTRLQAPASS